MCCMLLHSRNWKGHREEWRVNFRLLGSKRPSNCNKSNTSRCQIIDLKQPSVDLPLYVGGLGGPFGPNGELGAKCFTKRLSYPHLKNMEKRRCARTAWNEHQRVLIQSEAGTGNGYTKICHVKNTSLTIGCIVWGFPMTFRWNCLFLSPIHGLANNASMTWEASAGLPNRSLR